MLETVGVFEVPKQHGKYETGQVSVLEGDQLHNLEALDSRVPAHPSVLEIFVALAFS